ncbi:hypothetical protein HMPREF9425_1550 [Streptococcus vestibularis ATCC 49124]|uniref:Uncharacterized protein n=2 Tax=Streptococcus vestibularis TaxID=1343 RepID=E3CPP3_STRVE|nr:hypothetical protein HMPREF9192_0056 [Streptococcus vestibularis F0396]EFX95553.1 hypothetical protein HMPREF9425_1550 [Streptococcus vestibularis ATCC 49124]
MVLTAAIGSLAVLGYGLVTGKIHLSKNKIGSFPKTFVIKASVFFVFLI